MNALAVLMIVGCGGLAVAGVLPAFGARYGRAIGVGRRGRASLTLAAAGVMAAFGEHLVWQPFSWFALGRGGVQIDSLAGLFLIITGAVSAPLFLAASRSASRVSLACSGRRSCSASSGVFVVDNVFEFLILLELTAVAIYALSACATRIRRPSARPCSR